MNISNPFWAQKQTKSSNRYKILNTIRNKPSTHKELLEEIKLSRPILSQYLKELVNDGIIKRQIQGNEIKYTLTEMGDDSLKSLRESISKTFEIFTGLIHDHETMKALSSWAEVYRKDPIFVDRFMQFYREYILIYISKEMMRWLLKGEPTQEKVQALDEETRNRLIKERNEVLRKEVSKKVPIEPPTDTKELMTWIQNYLNAIKEVISSYNPEEG